jgi:prolyl-tRNA synthetase
MQDGKALQAGTSHYLGTGFAEAANIRFQDKDGGHSLCHTVSWGFSTRTIGAVIMTHGDDDGLRCPPRIAPHQIVIVPMLRDNEEDQAILDYCAVLQAELKALDAFREPLRVHLDAGANKAQTKRWGWVKKGAPIILEIGPRDVAGGNVAVIRRDRLYKDDGKLNTAFVAKGEFVAAAATTLGEIQDNLYAEAKERLHVNIRRDVTDLAAHYAGDDKFVGWVEVQWSRPTGAVLDGIVEKLKALKLTMRNTPLDAAPADGGCFFTGEPAVERVLIGRTY